MFNNLSFLSTRKGFNTSLKHFKLVNSMIRKIEMKNNLADLINIALENKQVYPNQYAPILNALLIDKYNYYTESFNLKTSFTGNLESISEQLKDWEKVDIILSYFHPQLKQILINPKNESSWESVGQLKENELIVAYVGYFNKNIEIDMAKKAVKAIKAIVNNEKAGNVKIFKGAPVLIETPVEQPVKQVKVKEKKTEVKKDKEEVQMQRPEEIKPTQPPAGGVPLKKKLSPQYGVLVSNELFHNGNVEAWKKIIASYELKYSDTKVLVFYEGEQIQDINTLFKWGKVKHGTNIYFALLGPEFRDVSKLRRYLAQGASNRFEDFLRGDPTKTLSLF